MNNHLSTVLFFVLVLISISAAAPSIPKWPPAYSATVAVRNVSNPSSQPFFWRWFQDRSLNQARLDGILFLPNIPTPSFASIYINETSKFEYVVLDQQDITQCFTRALTRPLFNPDFSTFKYIGQVSLYGYLQANLWSATNTTSGVTTAYYEDSATREPVRMHVTNADNQIEQWDYFELDATPQDPNLFKIPGRIFRICPSAPAKMFLDFY